MEDNLMKRKKTDGRGAIKETEIWQMILTRNIEKFLDEHI